MLAAALLLLGVATGDTTSVTARCTGAAAFLHDVLHMEVEVAPDTLNDWRTRERLPSCTVTAAGATTDGVQRAAAHLYEQLPRHGWMRTPDPRDAPREASLRFRRDGTDCLFNVNREAMLFTDAETAVLERLRVPPGAARYHVYVICVAAKPAAPRDSLDRVAGGRVTDGGAIAGHVTGITSSSRRPPIRGASTSERAACTASSSAVAWLAPMHEAVQLRQGARESGAPPVAHASTDELTTEHAGGAEHGDLAHGGQGCGRRAGRAAASGHRVWGHAGHPWTEP
jgi:hypothetical protein